MLQIGFSGSGNSLTVFNGGVVYNGKATMGSNSSSTNNTALVTGSRSVWNCDGALYIGPNGGGNSLSVTAGGMVSDVFGIIGDGSSRNTALVTGSGSVWSNNTFYVGLYGAGNSLTVADGGKVYSTYGNLGYSSSAVSNAALVTDRGSAWHSESELCVGEWGAGNSLVISNGAKVTDSTAYIGYSADNNKVVVDGAGSVWSNQGSVYVGNNGSSSNSLTISKGGEAVASKLVVNPRNLIALDGGSIVASGGLVISNGASLKGTCTIYADLTLAGTLAPGNSAGAITNFGNLTLQSSAVLNMELGGKTQATQYDYILVNGNVTFDGLLQVSFINCFQTNVLNSDTFTLLTATSSLSGSFTDVLSGKRLMTAGGEGSFLVSYNGNNLVLSDYKAIPEPATWSLLVLGAIALLGSCRMRRR